MSGYCSEADLALVGNSQLEGQLADYDKNTTADTGVRQFHIDTASYLIRSLAIQPRPDYKDLSTLAVSTFDPSTSTYQGLRRMTAWLAFDFERGAFRNTGDGVMMQHPVILWAKMVGSKDADLT